MKSTQKIIVGVMALFAVVGGYLYMGNSKTQPVEQTPVDSTNTTPTPVTTGATKYKNGTYTATGKYYSPAGVESLGVNLTISNNIVTNAQVTNKSNDKTSSNFQDKFIGGFSSLVLGNNVDAINLKVVSGASLTPGGFNDALAQIKAQATI